MSHQQPKSPGVIKKILNEQLWVFLLLAPLGLIAFLATVDYDAKPSATKTYKQASKRTSAFSIPEVSSVQMAMIVAKPVTELLKVKVYFKNTRRSKRSQSLAAQSAFAYQPVIYYAWATINQPGGITSDNHYSSAE